MNNEERIIAKKKSSPKKKISEKTIKPSKTKTKIKKSKSSKKNKFKLFMKVMLILFLIGLICGLIGMIALFVYIKSTAPEFDPSALFRSESSIIYAADGTEIATLGTEQREIISYSELPEVLIDAIIATEDSRFFQHNGFDLTRFTSATIQQLLGNSGAGGASTITMQVVYNNFTERVNDPIENLLRKFTDIYMSIFHIEENYSKEEILEFYVNIPFLGDNSYGVEQASINYFGKSAKDLNLSEAALIAGLFQAPTTYNPYIYPEKAERRRNTVLYLMRRHGYITEEEEAIANSIPIESLLRVDADTDQPYQGFVDTVVEEVITKTGHNPYLESMKIWTTMDITKQNSVNNILNGTTYTFENEVVQTGFTVTDIDTGAILAIGAGRNREGERSFNYATMMQRQPGSSAKPIYDYAPAIEANNWSTHYQILDDKISYTGGKEIGNWDNKYNGLMSMREALSLSRNTPALRAFQNTSNSVILDMALKLGMNPEVSNGYLHEAHSLGAYTGTNPLEMGGAFAAFGNGGYYVEPYSVEKIEYRATGEIYNHEIEKVQAMSSETAYMITSMLMTSVQTGLSSGAKLNGVQMAAKTGTTNFDTATMQNYNMPNGAVNDLWIVGYSPDYVVSLWYGYDTISNQYYNTAVDGLNRDSLYQAILKAVIPVNYSSFSMPNGLVEIEVEKETMPAMLPSENTPDDMKVKELFIKGTEPTEVSNRYADLPDVYNLSAVVSEDNIKLSWAFDYPDVINTDYLKNYFSSNIGSTFADQYVNERLSYNIETLGNLSWGIYLKSSDGTLEKVGSSTTNEFIYDIPSSIKQSNKLDFIVISEYDIMNNMNSQGIEVSATYVSTGEDKISISLKGEETINLSVNDSYEDDTDPIIVTVNEIETTDFVVSKEITLNNTKVSSIDFSKANTYVITYTVVYKNTTQTLKRTIIIK